MVAEEERRMISKRTKDALAAAKKRGTKLGGDRGAVPSKRTRALAVDALQARADAKAAGFGPDHQRATGGRENESEGHCRRLERTGHSNCARRQVVLASGDADAGTP